MNSEYHNNTELKLDRPNIVIKNIWLVYEPLNVYHTAESTASCNYDDDHTRDAKSILDRHIERFRNAWTELAEL